MELDIKLTEAFAHAAAKDMNDVRLSPLNKVLAQHGAKLAGSFKDMMNQRAKAMQPIRGALVDSNAVLVDLIGSLRQDPTFDNLYVVSLKRGTNGDALKAALEDPSLQDIVQEVIGPPRGTHLRAMLR